NPKVTFLVGCGTDLSNLVRLLESIKATSAGIAIEVILLVEEIETETARFIENNIRGLAACHTSESAGFLTTLNRAVANSKGEFFAVLKPSVLLRPNWLRELLSGT